MGRSWDLHSYHCPPSFLQTLRTMSRIPTPTEKVDILGSDASPIESVAKVPGSPNSLGLPPVIIDEKALWKKVDTRLLPILAFMYLFSFMDRANIGNARLQGLEKELKMTGDQYNRALIFFFIPYGLCEFPSNLILKKARPSRWLPLITVLWGLIVVATGFVQNFQQLLAARILLGVAEAGFYPGVVYYLSLWYPRYKFQTRIASFFGAASMAGAFSGLFAYGIAYMNGMRGLGGWSWIFGQMLYDETQIIEGMLTVVVGIVAYFVMVDFPSSAAFLTPAERQYLLDSQSTPGEEEHFEPRHVWAAVTDWQVYVFIVINLGFAVPLYGITFFSPTIINSFGYPPTITQLLSIPPYILATIFVYIFSYLSDTLCLRSPFLFFSLLISFSGYAISISSAPIPVKYFGIFLCVTGSYSGIPGLSAWQSNNTSGQYKRGLALALHIGFGNFGGAIGSAIFRKKDSPRFLLGYGLVLMFIALSMMAVGTAVVVYRTVNARREEIQRREVESGVVIGEEELQERRKQGDRAVDFRYTL
ncbi:MFS general substrate transporter [Coprinellus micaceus]|uniref:MFS general substrate transporter n=1 Tax=Coprinellus micaceus TaxID=71717 RepID=A0A4Y7SK66_COPMI|nr:MFS general substrate transporter [Coprinellus micaceus]